jgi:RNA polymerase sigma-70 factor, ECF subfamily
MSYLARVELPETYPPYRAFRESLRFLPAVFPAQSLLPRVIEAEAALAGAILLAPGALSRVTKEQIILAVAAANDNSYCVTVHAHILEGLGTSSERIRALVDGVHSGALDGREAALVDFGLTLDRRSASIGPADLDRLREQGFDDPEILEAILSTALARFLCTLSTGLGVEPDFESVSIPPRPAAAETPAPKRSERRKGPYLLSIARTPQDFPPFAFLLTSFGFVPALYRAQTLKPEALEAEALALRNVLLTEDALSRRQKEYIVLAVSAANLNTYCVTVHGEMLRVLGVPPEASDQIAADHRHAEIPETEKALLDFAVRLATRPQEYGEDDVRSLRENAFGEAQILEAVVMASLTNFLNTLQFGLGASPDFRPRRDLVAEALAERGRVEKAPDPDAADVARARAGDRDAFEALIRRHQAAVYRTLLGLTGNAADAEDCAQIVFVNVFRKIRDFGGASRFSTWLTRIAINEGLERLRRRKPDESLDDPGREEPFRPTSITPWVEDPERLYAREEMRQLIHQELSRLPAMYRTAVMLRDIEQLPAHEAAAALEIPVATLKTRLLRGRLMMREALAAYFTASSAGGGSPV